jgi:hypothetical protein
MNLRKAILASHSKETVTKIVQYVGKDRKRFKELVELFLEGPYRVTQRVSWPISYCVQSNPELINPWLKVILAFLKKDGIHPAVKRNTIRFLQFIEVPGKFWGPVTDICLKYLTDKKEPVAVRVFSMTVLSNLSAHIPEIRRELRLIIEDQLPYASPAFSSRAKKVLKQLDAK